MSSKGVSLTTLLIRGARQLITLRGPKEPRTGPFLQEIHPIIDGAVLIRDGIIVEVGPTRRVENLAEARLAREIDATGRIVMPGLVDAHTHLAFPTSSCDDPEIATRRVCAATGARLESRARAYVLSMARHGTTTVEAKTGCAPDESAESKLLRVLSALRGDPLDVVTSFFFRLPSHDPETAACAVVNELLPKVHKRRTSHYADIAVTGDPQALPVYEAFLSAARSLGFACRIHAESASAAVDLALRHGVASIDHLDCLTEADAVRLGRGGILSTLLPISSFHSDGPSPPARALIDAGAPVAIGTNFNPYRSPTLSMQTAILLACRHLKMTVEEAITAATINGAHALGCAKKTGSIEPGKVADLAILNLSDYHDLRNSLGTNAVHQTIKHGKVIYREADVSCRRTDELTLAS